MEIHREARTSTDQMPQVVHNPMECPLLLLLLLQVLRQDSLLLPQIHPTTARTIMALTRLVNLDHLILHQVTPANKHRQAPLVLRVRMLMDLQEDKCLRILPTGHRLPELREVTEAEGQVCASEVGKGFLSLLSCVCIYMTI